MKLTLTMRLDDPSLPLEYRKVIISLFKHALSHFESGHYLEKYYGPARHKDFCWALMLNKPEFLANKIKLDGTNINLIVSCASMESSYVLLSAFLKQVSIPFCFSDKNKIIITNVMAEAESQIIKNAASFRLLSPLCLRIHEREGNKDAYLAVTDERFVPELKSSIRFSIPEEKKHLRAAVDTLLIDTHLAKKTIIKHYDQMFACTLGTLTFVGEPELLEHINQNKLGSRKAAGFGLNLLNEQWSIEL